MNRAQRRKAERERCPVHNPAAGIRAVHDESGGALILQVIRPPEAIRLIEEAGSGDVLAGRLLEAFSQMIRKVEFAEPGTGPVCIACDREPEGTAYSVAIAAPYLNTPRHALALMVCCRCGTSVADVRGHAIKACRELWPDLRQFTPTHSSGGRA